MNFIKKNLKYFFLRTKTLFLLDKINYLTAHFKNFSKNKKFKKAYPNFKIPPDYFLYETYKLDYYEYKQDGDLTAKELIEWTQKYLPENSIILEWGSGVARIIRHFPKYVSSTTKLFAADINEEMIVWSKNYIDNIIFDKIKYLPPTHYKDNQFNLIYAISVFTHIESKSQYDWIKEINRILTGGGIFLFTTHGSKYFENLQQSDKEELLRKGYFTISYKQKGHRMMTTYNTYEYFRGLIEKHFKILEYYDGEKFQEKVGGQDLWIVQKL